MQAITQTFTQTFNPASLLQPVTVLRGKESEAFEAVGYNSHLQMLVVQFKRGAIYRILRVTVSQHRDFIAAESLGRAFNKMFRPLGRRVRRIDN